MYLKRHKNIILIILFNIICGLLLYYCGGYIYNECNKRKTLCYLEKDSTNHTVISYTIGNNKKCKYNINNHINYKYITCYYDNNLNNSTNECPILNCALPPYSIIILVLSVIYLIEFLVSINILQRIYQFTKIERLKNK
jgi:hypothetical protein